MQKKLYGSAQKMFDPPPNKNPADVAEPQVRFLGDKPFSCSRNYFFSSKKGFLLVNFLVSWLLATKNAFLNSRNVFQKS